MYYLASTHHFLAFEADDETVLYRRQDKQTLLLSGALHRLYQYIERRPTEQVFDFAEIEVQLDDLEPSELKHSFERLVAMKVLLPAP